MTDGHNLRERYYQAYAVLTVCRMLFTLATGDAHGLYAQFGFTAPLYPQTLMERYFPGLYTAALQQREATPEPTRHTGHS